MATIEYVVNAIDSASATFTRIAGSADDLNAKLDDLSHKSATARVGLDGDDKAKLALDEIELKLAKIADKLAKPKITVEGQAKALLDIAALNLALDKLNAKKVDPGSSSSGPSGLSKLLSGVGGKIGGAGGSIPGIGGLFGDSGPGGAAAIIAVVSAAQALLTELAGVAAGFTAAGLGIGSLALLAVPALKKVENAWTAISAAQAKYNTAVEKEKLDPTKSNAAAVATALLNLKVAQDQAGPGTLSIIGGIKQLTGAFSKMAAAFQPTILKIFNAGLGIANQLLPYVAKFAAAAAPAVEGLMKALSKQIDSKGFKDFMAQMAKLTPASITAIGKGVGLLAGDFAQLLTIMSKKDVINSINIAFGVLHVVMLTLIGVIKFSMDEWDFLSAAFRRAVAAAQWLGRELEGLGGAAQHAGQSMYNAITGAVSAVIGWFQALPGRIVGSLGDTGRLLWNAGVNVILGFAGGMNSMLGTIEQTAENIGATALHGVEKFLHIGSPSKVMFDRGMMTVKGFELGMAAGLPGITHSAELMSGAATSGGYSSGYGRPGGGNVVFQPGAIVVNAPVGSSPRDIGRGVADVLKAYIKGGGMLYPAGVKPR